MIRSLREGAPAEAQHADICIVGAGAAGIVLAVELLEQGKSVLLLEGGGADVEVASQEPYRSEIAGLKHNGVHIGRFRAVGGSTTRWGGQILELDQEDFEQRSWVQGSGWPIQKTELAPYYARAIALEGLSNAILNDEDVWHLLKLTPPAFDPFRLVFSRWCPDPNFRRVYADTLQNHPGLTLWMHANAVEMRWEGARFRSVRCRSLGGVEGTFSADQFIFSLGGIESSRFFLQPGAAAGPWGRSGLLGLHFQDHIVCRAATFASVKPAAFHRVFDNVFSRGMKYQPKIRLKPEIQRAAETLNVAASIAFNSDFDEAFGRIKQTARHLLGARWSESSVEDVLHALRYTPLLARQVMRYLIHQRAYNPPDAVVGLLVHCEQEPESKSRITLSDERDSLGMLRTRLDWQISDREIYSMRTFVEHALHALRALGRLDPDRDLMALDPAFKQKCGDGYHHMGGMRMAVSPGEGVVNPDLRLHGMENGYVLSSAVYPSSGYSNPTHTLLALAVRLADHLR